MGRDLRAGRGVTVAAPAAAPAIGTVLCRLDDIADPGGREFSFGRPPHMFEMFVVRQGERAFGYVNDCPHTHSPLNWLADRLDRKSTRLNSSH